MQVADDKVVTIDFTVRDEEGQLIDSTPSAEPFSYIHGKEQVVPGLERALDGKSPGDTVQVTVQPKEGYGVRDESLVFDLPREQFTRAGIEQPEEGMQLQVQGEDQPFLITVTGVQGQSVRVDANHPLAGVTLSFDVTVVDVREASSEELDHGHVHGHHEGEEDEEEEDEEQ